MCLNQRLIANTQVALNVLHIELKRRQNGSARAIVRFDVVGVLTCAYTIAPALSFTRKSAESTPSPKF